VEATEKGEEINSRPNPVHHAQPNRTTQ